MACANLGMICDAVYLLLAGLDVLTDYIYIKLFIVTVCLLLTLKNHWNDKLFSNSYKNVCFSTDDFDFYLIFPTSFPKNI